MNDAEVLLLSMPFGLLRYPSLGLSLLKAGLRQKRITAAVRYFHLDFARTIGVNLYNEIAGGFPNTRDLVGEWMFSHTLFPDKQDDTESYIREILRGENRYHAKPDVDGSSDLEELVENVLVARRYSDDFIDHCMRELEGHLPTVVGITSMFQQNTASLSLAKRIKDVYPDTLIVFGGANCEGEMGREMIRQFDFVDVAVSGEGDRVFPALVGHYLQTRTILSLKGVITRDNVERLDTDPVADMVMQLDDLPVPDHGDYFQQIRDLELEDTIHPEILFESSRGCWWGEKQHCTFCGFNGSKIRHRSKSAHRVFSELHVLSREYPARSAAATDNILDMRYFEDLIPLLSKNPLGGELFYQVRANLTKEQLQQLVHAHITRIQPGIESLSDEVLRSMRKGVRAIQNIQLLKWCKELGIAPYWNFLWGFPGESPGALQQMAELVPVIAHLAPPVSTPRLRVDRYSPYHTDPHSLGLKNVRPFPSYSYIYPYGEAVLQNMAYYFSHDYQDDRDAASSIKGLIGAVKAWKDAYSECELLFLDTERRLLIWDFRPAAKRELHVLNEKERFVYLQCDAIRSFRQIKDAYFTHFQTAFDDNELADILRTLMSSCLSLQSGNHYLSLAVPLGKYTPSATIWRKMASVLRQRGEEAERGMAQVTVPRKPCGLIPARREARTRPEGPFILQ